ncbi:MAG: hypothetical protein NE334_19580 [Lentisphaeraceae bacterium]|nr:hypothetical protein [Lentisphaeraceae bacterium]
MNLLIIFDRHLGFFEELDIGSDDASNNTEPRFNLEEKAYASEPNNENYFARQGWGSPGKNDLTRDDYND